MEGVWPAAKFNVGESVSRSAHSSTASWSMLRFERTVGRVDRRRGMRSVMPLSELTILLRVSTADSRVSAVGVNVSTAGWSRLRISASSVSCSSGPFVANQGFSTGSASPAAWIVGVAGRKGGSENHVFRAF